MKMTLVKVVNMIRRDPSNRGQVLRRFGMFLAWQLFKRIARAPLVVVSCGKRFLAYPDCPVSSMLLYYRVPECEELAVLKSYRGTGDVVFFDVGSNIGFYSLALSGDFASLHSFEPNPEIFRRLNENCALNGLAIKANKCAVSDKEGTMYLSLKGKADPTAHLLDQAGEGALPVPVVSLDCYIESNNIQGKIAAKIDVEGAELAVLRGASSALRQKRFSVIQCECLNAESFASIRAFAVPLGYGMYSGAGGKLHPAVARREGVNNYYLLPAGTGERS